ncbi:MAG: hypothetical protein K2X81_18305 [Candidatus Obscuribacterales bacterium]|nr:hypothetical protein [Candidatus Obscuribacterales bacterium]
MDKQTQQTTSTQLGPEFRIYLAGKALEALSVICQKRHLSTERMGKLAIKAADQLIERVNRHCEDSSRLTKELLGSALYATLVGNAELLGPGAISWDDENMAGLALGTANILASYEGK